MRDAGRYRTCTVQANLDFSSEADMVKKLRVRCLRNMRIEG
jgi:gamma-glutamylcysteine synthetase